MHEAERRGLPVGQSVRQVPLESARLKVSRSGQFSGSGSVGDVPDDDYRWEGAFLGRKRARATWVFPNCQESVRSNDLLHIKGDPLQF